MLETSMAFISNGKRVISIWLYFEVGTESSELENEWHYISGAVSGRPVLCIRA